jgi:hypothetical protein
MSEETIPQMRETIERISGERNSALKEVTKLNGELRIRDSREAFRLGGYDPRHGDLFAKQTETDISPENVTAFADEWNLAAVEATSEPEVEGEETSEADDGSEALSGMSGSGTAVGEGGSGGASEPKLTRQQWQQLMLSDPAKARAAAASGQVEISVDNPYLGSDRVRTPSGSNPYSLPNEVT